MDKKITESGIIKKTLWLTMAFILVFSASSSHFAVGMVHIQANQLLSENGEDPFCVENGLELIHGWSPEDERLDAASILGFTYYDLEIVSDEEMATLDQWMTSADQEIWGEPVFDYYVVESSLPEDDIHFFDENVPFFNFNELPFVTEEELRLANESFESFEAANTAPGARGEIVSEYFIVDEFGELHRPEDFYGERVTGVPEHWLSRGEMIISQTE